LSKTFNLFTSYRLNVYYVKLYSCNLSATKIAEDGWRLRMEK